MICPECGGSGNQPGYVISRQYGSPVIDCGRCHGTGKVSMFQKKKWFPCGECKGRGKLRTGGGLFSKGQEYTCQVCNGTGGSYRWT